MRLPVISLLPIQIAFFVRGELPAEFTSVIKTLFANIKSANSSFSNAQSPNYR